MTTLALLTAAILVAPPPMAAQLFALPLTEIECRTRSLRALEASGLKELSASGAAVVASSETDSASIACIPSSSAVMIHVTAAGPNAEEVARKLEGAMRISEVQGDGPFTGVWDGASSWGFIVLEQNGAELRGSYSCCGTGILRGTVKGNVARFSWIAMSGATRGETAVRLMKNGDLEGSWCSGKGCEPKEDHPFLAKGTKR